MLLTVSKREYSAGLNIDATECPQNAYPSGCGHSAFLPKATTFSPFPGALDLCSRLEATSFGQEKDDTSRGCPLFLQKQRAFLLHFTCARFAVAPSARHDGSQGKIILPLATLLT
jgi:hypothetical protein